MKILDLLYSFNFSSHLLWFKPKVILVKPCEMEKCKFNEEEESVMHDIRCHYCYLPALVSFH